MRIPIENLKSSFWSRNFPFLCMFYLMYFIFTINDIYVFNVKHFVLCQCTECMLCFTGCRNLYSSEQGQICKIQSKYVFIYLFFFKEFSVSFLKCILGLSSCFPYWYSSCISENSREVFSGTSSETLAVSFKQI